MIAIYGWFILNFDFQAKNSKYTIFLSTQCDGKKIFKELSV